jgi:predicted N-acetyltransferase YhbS
MQILRISTIQNQHWPDIEAIQNVCYPPVAQESLAALMSHWRVAPHLCFVAIKEEAIADYLLAHPSPRRAILPLGEVYEGLPNGCDSVFVHDLAILPAMRGYKLATLLVQEVLQVSQNQGYEHFSLISVQGTAKFWQRFGFVANPVGTEYAAAVARFYPGANFSWMEKFTTGNRDHH